MAHPFTPREWTVVYKQVFAIAHSFTRTDDHRRAFTEHDRAQEAVQRACLRYLHMQPREVTTTDALRGYLVAAVRSELGHAAARAQTRRELEDHAAREDAALGRGAHESVEVAKVERSGRAEQIVRARWLSRRLERVLTRDGDKLAVDTIRCVARGVTEPEAQARDLGVEVEEIYNARKRRKRAMQRVLEEYARRTSDDEDDSEKEGS
jgi:hypothetical protein